MIIKITIVNNNSTDYLPEAHTLSLFKGDQLSCYVQGQIECIETKHSFIFIVGYIQDHDFLCSEKREDFFEEQDITAQLKRLNGHFSLIKVCKKSENFTIYSNKSGGNRIYFRQIKSTWVISNKIKQLITDKDCLNKTAVEEEFLYRWISGEQSLINNIYQTPSGHYWQIQNGIIIKKECYYRFPAPLKNIDSALSIKEHTAKAKVLLSQSLNKMLKRDKKIAILLSGGVDSSILAGLANEHGHNLVAISHRSLQHENPELNTAIQFAQKLNIEHRIIEVSDDEIAEAFKQCTQIIEQAPRYQSSVILYLIFAKLAGEFSQVIYGEAADTLFGNNLLKQYIARFNKQKQAKKVPFVRLLNKLMPKKSKLSVLLSETVKSYLRQTNQLTINDNVLTSLSLPAKNEHNFYRFIQIQSPDSSLLTNLLKIKRFVLEADVDNHFHETGALAANFGLELVSPFVDIDVINFAAQLPLDQTINCEYVKPILRKIGELYFEPELMYLPKRGFPAPHLKWLENCLKKHVDESVNFFNSPLAKELDPESQWTLAALSILLKDFNLDFNIAK